MKKSTLWIVGLLIIALHAVHAAPLHEAEKLKIKVDPYDKVQVSGPYEVKLVSGEPGEITIAGDEDIARHILVTSTHGMLTIKTDKEHLTYCRKFSSIKITIPIAVLNGLTLNGSGSIKYSGVLNNNIKIGLNGSGCISMCVNTTDVTAGITGSGDIKLKGTAKNFSCKIAGSGTINALNLTAANVEAAVTGSGDVLVMSNKAIKGRIQGSGTISFSGEPKDRDLKRTGSGEFKVVE